MRALLNPEYRHRSQPHLDLGAPTAVKPSVWPTDFEPPQPIFVSSVTDGARQRKGGASRSAVAINKDLAPKLSNAVGSPRCTPSAASAAAQRGSAVAPPRPAAAPLLLRMTHYSQGAATKKKAKPFTAALSRGASCGCWLSRCTAAVVRRLLGCCRSRGLPQALPRRCVQLRAAAHGQLQPVLELPAAPLAPAHQLRHLLERQGGRRRRGRQAT